MLNKYIILIILVFTTSAIAIEQPYSFGVQGKVYDVKEDDMLDLIKTRLDEYLANHNVKKTLQKAVQRQFQNNINFPVCKEEKSFINKMEFTVQEDIFFKGQYIAKKGDKYKLLERNPLNGYIFFANYNNEDDKELLIELINAYKEKNIRINIVNGNLYNAKKDIENKFPELNNINIGKASKLIMQKFNLKCIPVIIQQKDTHLIISEFSPTDN